MPVKTTVLVTGVAALYGFGVVTRGHTEQPEIHGRADEHPTTDTLRLMTLNIAHGRGVGFHQLMMPPRQVYRNLDEIASVIRREKVHICALQESEGRSPWSAKMHQSRYLSENSGLHYCLQGRHVHGMKFSYGTALLSQLPLSDPHSLTFHHRAPSPCKGFVISTLEFQGVSLDVVSVHFDFLRPKVRHQQADMLISYCRERCRPVIVMGDMNAGWNDKSVVSRLCRELHLTTWKAEESFITFPKTRRRLDWILVPEPLVLTGSHVLADRISDHLGVVAELKLKDT